MGKLILTLGLSFGLIGLQARATTPTSTAVSDTVRELLRVSALGTEAQRVAGLCQLAFAKVDNNAIGLELLGRQFSNLEKDKTGIQRFMALVPSVIVNEFYSEIRGLGTEFTILGETPKGSSKSGVRVQVGGSDQMGNMVAGLDLLRRLGGIDGKGQRGEEVEDGTATPSSSSTGWRSGTTR